MLTKVRSYDHEKQGLRFVQVVSRSPTSQRYLVLEMNGWAEYAVICTDTDGNN